MLFIQDATTGTFDKIKNVSQYETLWAFQFKTYDQAISTVNGRLYEKINECEIIHPLSIEQNENGYIAFMTFRKETE